MLRFVPIDGTLPRRLTPDRRFRAAAIGRQLIQFQPDQPAVLGQLQALQRFRQS